ncbi:HNH endonuclease [Clostridium saccharoperbutylacetonicum]|uniref:HNH endonuclease n=1 Tax=Clostridium saccharoperbutylacetonicum TaxID=36745 RepID=UPI0039E98409
MENSVDKSNLIVRAALYLEYEGKCFYEGLPIRFQDMHVDHIIPEYLEGTDEFKKIIKTLGLPENFNINSVYNLVPCNPNVNQVKNKTEYPVEFLSHCINIRTKPKAEKIKERVKKLKDEYKADKKLAKLTAMLNEYDNKEKLEELYNTLSREKSFSEFSEVNKDGNFYTYTKSLSNVYLSGFIPLYPNLEGSCLITFSNLRLRDCMITLNHKQIMKSLFSGVNTDLDLKLRNYIIYPYGDKEEIYYVDLANTRIPLERKEVEQLTKIIDDFYDYYIKECRYLYFLLSRDKFEKSDGGCESNQVRLLKISKQLWSDILRFCREFDYDNGDSKWNIFDSGSSFIKVYCKNQRQFKTFIIPEIEHSKYIISEDESIWLVWTDEFQMDRKIEYLENDMIWSPSYTYKWLVDKLIPYVIYYYSNDSKGLFKKKVSFEDFKNNCNISNFVNSVQDHIKEDYSILEFVTKLQEFYSIYRNDYYSSADIINLYESLKLIIDKTHINSEGLDYVIRKLGIIDTLDKNEILNKLDGRIKSIGLGGIYSAFTIDNIFRCMLVSLSDYKNILTEDEMVLIKKKLDVFEQKRIIDDIRRNF